MKLVKIEDLFVVNKGAASKSHFNKLEECEKDHPNAVRYLSRTGENNGQKAYVKKITSLTPAKEHCLSVAVSGSVLSCFYQPDPFYNGQDLFILRPKETMTIEQMMYFAICIERNKNRYNYGRQANATLHKILIPSEAPIGLDKINNCMKKDIITIFT